MCGLNFDDGGGGGYSWHVAREVHEQSAQNQHCQRYPAVTPRQMY